MDIIERKFQELNIVFTSDGWINATETAKHFNKNPYEFLRSKQFKEYENALAKHLNTETENLRFAIKGGNDLKRQGTYLHPDLLIIFARWLSAEFAVWCDMLVKDYLKGVINKAQTTIDELINERDKGRFWMND